MLSQKLHIELPTSHYNAKDGIVQVVLNMLEKVLEDEGEPIGSGDMMNDSMGESDPSMNNFYLYEMRTKQKYEVGILNLTNGELKWFIYLV